MGLIKLVEFILITGITILILIVLIASYFDLKYKEIPNLLTVPTIIFGIIFNSVYSILINEFNFILNSIFISLAVFLLSYLLWKFRIWGGGDVKLLTAIGAVLPIHPLLFSNLFNFMVLGEYFPKIAIYPFPFTIILNSILISFPLLISILLLNYLKKIYRSNYLKSTYKSNYLKNSYKSNSFNQKSQSLSGQKFHLKISNFFKFFKYILKLLFSKIKFNVNHSLNDLKKEGYKYTSFKKLAISSLISAILLLIILSLKNYKFISFSSFVNILIVGILLSFIFSFFNKYFISNFKVFVKKGSCREFYFEDLEEGMILDDVYIDIEKSKDILNHIQEDNIANANNNANNINNNTNNINNNTNSYHNFNFDINEKNKKHILKSKTTAGLTKKDISILKSLVKSDIVPNYLPIKWGIPFGPSIAIGLIISIFIGDLTLLLFTTFNSYLF